ncbi:PadR family transcriptional regulator [Streptomyces sp. TP-A0874]|uniref:PadR family transcriptional regulator n=1 Tax=Streptomyces sp. TP-A0874 TaxID=549819 RepID=UPI000852A52E|nr:PadR family transcriptional regulator [Streptomyces sp. TP-A0874]
MAPVFGHGRLRLYLLKLLDEAPRHGYEVIRLLEERFQGLYAPSAGTVYPRLAKLESEGLVTHTTEGGRKIYSLTDAGHSELTERQDELAELELEIGESVSELAAEIRADVHGSANDLRREMRAAVLAARAGTRRSARSERTGRGTGAPLGEKEAWREAKEELRRAKDRWREQARRATEESRRAQQDAERARSQAKAAQQQAREQVLRVARRLQEQTQEHVRAGDWQNAVRAGLAELSQEMRKFSAEGGVFGEAEGADEPSAARQPSDGERWSQGGESSGVPLTKTPLPEWAEESGAASEDPVRDLERLLDRFRDDIRDIARDRGVSEEQLREARGHLAAAAARVEALLRTPEP